MNGQDVRRPDFDTAGLLMAKSLPSSDSDARVRRLWLALVALGVALFANQWLTMRTFKALVLADAPNAPVASLGQSAWRVLATSWPMLLTPGGVAAAAGVFLALAFIVRAEIIHGAVTELLARAERSNAVLTGFLGLASVVIARVYVAPGQVFMGDSETHMLRAWMFVEHFTKLEAPTWSNAWYGGFPLLVNYGPLYFIATALLTLGLGDIHTATKVLLWSCHVGSMFAMWAYLRETTGHRLAALVGALAFGLSFHRLHIVLYQGDLQVAVSWLLLPLALLTVERFLRGRLGPRAAFVQLAINWAVAILSHQGYAFFGLVFLAIYVVARLASTPWPWRERARALVLVGVSVGAALTTSAFLLVPYVFDTSEFRGMGSSPFAILVPNPLGPIMLVKLFRWSIVGDGGTIGYVGLSIGLMAIAGAREGLRRRDPVVIALVTGAVATLLMVRSNVAYNVKNIDFFVFFVSALAAYIVPAATAWGSKRAVRMRGAWGARFPARVTVLATALLLADLGLSTFQSPFRENYEFKQPMYERLAALGPYKVIERQVLRYDPARPPDAYFDSNKIGVPSAYASLQTPLGFFHEGAGKSFGYSTEMVKQLHRDLNAGHVSDLTVKGLYVMGVQHVLFRDRYQWFTPELEPSPQFSVQEGILTVAHATPLVTSQQVVTLDDLPGYPKTDLMRSRRYLEPETFDYSSRYFTTLVQPILDRMDLDLERGTAAALVSADPALRVNDSAGERAEVLVERYATDLKHVAVDYRASGDTVGQLPYTFFPYLHVAIDGRPVPFYRSAMSTILLRLPAGSHSVSIAGTLPPMQASMLWVSAAALLVVIAVPRRMFGALELRP